jgi:hypothetical protein
VIARIAAALGVAGTIASGWACGGSSLPETVPCPAPTPTPQAIANDVNMGFDTRYQIVVALGTQELTSLLDGFRGRWPGDTFYRSEEFRADFAQYTTDAICVAEDLSGVEPSPKYAQAHERLRRALATYVEALEEGRDAVAQRNTSGYRDWVREMDEAEAGIDAVLLAMEQQ